MTLLIIVLVLIAFGAGVMLGIRVASTPLDDGPWELFYDQKNNQRGVMSDDFDADVVLRVDGDFESDDHKREYCEWLRDTLNASGEQSK